MFSRLASGMRINQASEDASGLAISERLRAMIESYDAAEENALHGVSLTQTADSALSTVGESLGRMREVAVQGANETLSDEDRAHLQSEFESLRDTITAVHDQADLNGVRFLDSPEESISVQVGPDAGQTIEIETEGISAEDLGLDGAGVSTVEDAGESLSVIDSALESVESLRGRFGIAQNELTSALHSIGQTRESLVQAESRIRDADMAAEAAELTRQRILSFGGAASMTQANVSSAAAQQLLAG